MDTEVIKYCLKDVIEKGLMLDLDSAKEILEFIDKQAETIDQQQIEIEKYRYRLGLRSDYKGEQNDNK